MQNTPPQYSDTKVGLLFLSLKITKNKLTSHWVFTIFLSMIHWINLIHFVQNIHANFARKSLHIAA